MLLIALLACAHDVDAVWEEYDTAVIGELTEDEAEEACVDRDELPMDGSWSMVARRAHTVSLTRIDFETETDICDSTAPGACSWDVARGDELHLTPIHLWLSCADMTFETSLGVGAWTKRDRPIGGLLFPAAFSGQ